MPLPRIGDLELDENMHLQRIGWRVQRVGWVCMGVLIAAALAGLFGSGPLARTEAIAEPGVRIEYPLLARRQSPESLYVRIAQLRGEEVEISLERGYLEKLQIERIEPPPRTVLLLPGRVVYVFPAEEGASVSFRFTFEGFGVLRGLVRAGGAAVPLFHFVYP